MQATSDIISSHPTGFRRRFAPAIRVAAIVLAVGSFLLVPARPVSAHAEPERADPPINGRVVTPPSIVEVWFTEEVQTQTAVLSVKGPDGSVVDLGDTQVDLFDPERKRVTVSLKPGLSAGNYVVQWTTFSAGDGDEATGFIGFYIEQGNASPAAARSPATGSPIASPAASPRAIATAVPTVQPTLVSTVEPTATGPTPVPGVNTTGETEDFDSRAFGLAILAGLAAAVAIFLFWRAVKPKQSA